MSEVLVSFSHILSGMGAVHIKSAVLRTAAVIAGIVLAAAVIAGTAAVIPIVIMTGAIPICSAMVLLAAAAAIIMVIMGSACSIMLSALTILLIHAAAVLTVPIVRATALPAMTVMVAMLASLLIVAFLAAVFPLLVFLSRLRWMNRSSLGSNSFLRLARRLLRRLNLLRGFGSISLAAHFLEDRLPDPFIDGAQVTLDSNVAALQEGHDFLAVHIDFFGDLIYSKFCHPHTSSKTTISSFS